MTTSKKWLKITLPCPDQLTEAVSDLIGVLSGVGVEIHPVGQNGLNEISGFFECENSSDTPGEKTTANLTKKVSEELEKLFTLYNMKLPQSTTEIIDDQEWATSWQQYFKAVEIVPGLVIKPSWETFTAAQNQHVLEMDPGMAFGTGQHESTRLALSLISSCFKNGKNRIASVLDVGTGTGILAMAAAVFGAQKVTAIDNDPEAVSVAGSNVRQNRLNEKIVLSGSLLADIHGAFDLICANIVHDVLVDMAPEFKRLLIPGGHVVLAGILSGDQVKSIIRAYGKYGMQMVETRNEGDWTGILLRLSP